MIDPKLDPAELPNPKCTTHDAVSSQATRQIELIRRRGTRLASPSRMDTQRIVHRRKVTAVLLTLFYAAISIVCLAVLGVDVWPMFVVPLPFAMVLLWDGVNVLRSDEARPV